MVVTGTNEAEAATQAGQSVELRQRARDNQVAVFVHQGCYIVGVAGDETGIGLVDEHHRVVGDVLHDAANLIGRQTVARGVVGRCQQEHARMNAVGIFDDLVDVVGKGVVLLVQGIHLEGAIAFAGHLIIVPPRKFRNQNLLVVALHQVVVDGVLQNVLTAIGQQHLLLGHSIQLAQPHADDAFLPLVVDAGVEAQVLGVEVLDGLYYFIAGLEIELVAV